MLDKLFTKSDVRLERVRRLAAIPAEVDDLEYQVFRLRGNSTDRARRERADLEGRLEALREERRDLEHKVYRDAPTWARAVVEEADEILRKAHAVDTQSQAVRDADHLLNYLNGHVPPGLEEKVAAAERIIRAADKARVLSARASALKTTVRRRLYEDAPESTIRRECEADLAALRNLAGE